MTRNARTHSTARPIERNMFGQTFSQYWLSLRDEMGRDPGFSLARAYFDDDLSAETAAQMERDYNEHEAAR